MIYIIGIIISFFLSLLILTKKGRNRADLILGVWMLVVGVHLMTFYGFMSGAIFQYPYLLGINIPIPFLHGALLYLYVEALTTPQAFRSKRWLWHFVLPIFIILLDMPFYVLSEAEKMEVYKNQGKGFETVMSIGSVLLNISGVFYVIITHRLLQKHKKRILNQFSNQEKINLNWLQMLTYAMVGMWVLIIVVQNDIAIFTAASVFVIFIGYFGIKQVGIFTNVSLPSTLDKVAVEEEIVTVEEPHVEKKKYAKSGLNEEMVVALHRRLRVLMEKERLFTEPELTLTDLANRLEVHPNYLSQVINEMEEKNFYDYVNGLRIEEFKRLVRIPENQRFTLLALAYDCGFNSKSAFNRFFKKATDLSPSEYVKKL